MGSGLAQAVQGGVASQRVTDGGGIGERQFQPRNRPEWYNGFVKTSESETTENKLSLSERKETTESVAAFAAAFVRNGLSDDGRRGGIQIGCLMHAGACEE